MKLHLFGLFCAALLLSACGKSEEEKFYEKMNKDMEISKIRQEHDSCLRQNRINNTNVDCDKKFPVPEK